MGFAPCSEYLWRCLFLVSIVNNQEEASPERHYAVPCSGRVQHLCWTDDKSFTSRNNTAAAPRVDTSIPDRDCLRVVSRLYA